MYNDSKQHTLELLKLFHKDLPPFVPAQIQDRMSQVLEHAEQTELHSDELDKIAIIFGKYLWPFWKGFQEIFDEHYKNMGEDFFVSHLENPIRLKYRDAKASGVNFDDFYFGRNLQEFSGNERVLIRKALVDAFVDLKKFTKQSVFGAHRVKYEKALKKYRQILNEIDKEFEKLKKLAEKEAEDFPELAEEIHSKVNFFEHGLCRLAPEVNYKDVFGAAKYFNDRKIEKNFLKR